MKKQKVTIVYTDKYQYGIMWGYPMTETRIDDMCEMENLGRCTDYVIATTGDMVSTPFVPIEEHREGKNKLNPAVSR